MRLLLAATLATTLFGTAAWPQAAPDNPGCKAPSAATVTPATPPASGATSGTDPGGAGSTGFSGAGLGGAYTGTMSAGPSPSSPSVQPATARGLDPIGAPPKPASAGKC